MKQVPIRPGPLALLLTVVGICLTMLAILTFTTARADLRLAEKYANTVSLRYELEAEGQRWLSEVQKGTVKRSGDGTYRVTLEKDGSLLSIAAAGEDGEVRVLSWRHTRAWEPDTAIGNLWTGN